PASLPPPGTASDCSCLLLVVVCVRARQAPGLAQCVAQHVFDLGVEAAQLVVGPPLRRRQHVGTDAQRIGLALGHQPPRPRRICITTEMASALTATTIATTTPVATAWLSPAKYRPAASASMDIPIRAQRRARARA